MSGTDVRSPSPAKLHNCCPFGISTPTRVPSWTCKTRSPMKAGGVSEVNPPIGFPVLASSTRPVVGKLSNSRHRSCHPIWSDSVLGLAAAASVGHESAAESRLLRMLSIPEYTMMTVVATVHDILSLPCGAQKRQNPPRG